MSSSDGYTCIECSRPFQNSDTEQCRSWRELGMPGGIGICPRCLKYGPAPGLARRNWDMVDEEQLEYGVNASEIASDRIALGLEGKPLKTKWHENNKMKLYIYLRGWQNSLQEKINRGMTGEVVRVLYFSTSQEDYLGGWISSIDGENRFTITRRPTKGEVEKAKKDGKTVPMSMTRSNLELKDLAPPIMLKNDRPLPKIHKCNGSCGLIHSDLTLGKENGWGDHIKNGGSNMFCRTCLPDRAIPETAGSDDVNHHIGFCKPQFCGCWSCSASNVRTGQKNHCIQCDSFSSDGWIDRKTTINTIDW